MSVLPNGRQTGVSFFGALRILWFCVTDESFGHHRGPSRSRVWNNSSYKEVTYRFSSIRWINYQGHLKIITSDYKNCIRDQPSYTGDSNHVKNRTKKKPLKETLFLERLSHSLNFRGKQLLKASDVLTARLSCPRLGLFLMVPGGRCTWSRCTSPVLELSDAQCDWQGGTILYMQTQAQSSVTLSFPGP